MRIRHSTHLGIIKHTGHAAAVSALLAVCMFAGAIFMFQADTEQQRFESTAGKYDAMVTGARQERSPARGSSYFINVYFRHGGSGGQEKEFEVPREVFNRFRDATSVAPQPTKVYCKSDAPYYWHVENAILKDPPDRIYVAIGWTFMGFVMLAVTVVSWRRFMRGQMQVQADGDDPSPEVIAHLRAAGIPEALIPQPAPRPWVPPVGAAPPAATTAGDSSAPTGSPARPEAAPWVDLPPWEQPKGSNT